MSSDLVAIFLLSLTAMANPTLLAAVTVLLLLPNPRRLMFGYLLGAFTTSIASGLVIVFALHGTGAESTAKRTVSPLEDIVLGVLALALALALQSRRSPLSQERRQARKEAHLKARQEAGKPTEPLAMRMLSRGNAKVTFVVGAALSFPGVSYLAALNHIHKLDPSAVAAVLLVVLFCVIQETLLELPLLGYVFAPDRTQEAVTRFRNWVATRGRHAVVTGAVVIGVLLITRGAISLV